MEIVPGSVWSAHIWGKLRDLTETEARFWVTAVSSEKPPLLWQSDTIIPRLGSPLSPQTRLVPRALIFVSWRRYPDYMIRLTRKFVWNENISDQKIKISREERGGRRGCEHSECLDKRQEGKHYHVDHWAWHWRRVWIAPVKLRLVHSLIVERVRLVRFN